MPLVLVVDDAAALAEQYAYDLARMGGYQTLVASGGAEALATLEVEDVDCVILDLEMPGTDGFEVLRRMKKAGIAVPVIVYTGTGSYDRCMQAIRLGAHSFIDKAESMERVALEVENALEKKQLASEVETLRREVGADTPLVGTSKAIKRLHEEIARVAPVPSPVLVTGESGSGKELVARELHRLGTNPGGPFVAINSAALPEGLLESELFGHERGAFTGANRTRKGAFERAENGTLFLDEIGELPPDAQARLLRALEQREVTRVGGERTIAVNARVIAATHRNLHADVEANRFRNDLYFRLNVHTLVVPPLRERSSDIPALAEHFVASICERYGIRAKRIAPDAMTLLQSYDWSRNNVRELRNVVERMIIATDGDAIGTDAVPAEIRGTGETQARSLKDLKADAEREIIVAALERNSWQIGRTAEELGLADHSSLLKIMRRHGLKRGD